MVYWTNDLQVGQMVYR